MKLALGILAAIFLAATARATEANTPGVVQEIYGGWTDGLALRGGDCKVVIVPSIGGRVLNFSLNGENIIFDSTGANGRTLLTFSNISVGGYQLDIGPELRGVPDHKWLWQGPWNWRVPRPFAVHVFSDPEKNIGVQLEKEFVIDRATRVCASWMESSSHRRKRCPTSPH